MKKDAWCISAQNVCSDVFIASCIPVYLSQRNMRIFSFWVARTIFFNS